MKDMISLEFIRSKNNLADLLTKYLIKAMISEILREMGLKPIY